jgi:hypothetical protein
MLIMFFPDYIVIGFSFILVFCIMVYDFTFLRSCVTWFDPPLQVRMDPRNREIDLDNLMYGNLKELSDEDLRKQEGDYIYRYRYNGGGATQVWLSSDRYLMRSTWYHVLK